LFLFDCLLWFDVFNLAEMACDVPWVLVVSVFFVVMKCRSTNPAGRKKLRGFESLALLKIKWVRCFKNMVELLNKNNKEYTNVEPQTIWRIEGCVSGEREGTASSRKGGCTMQAVMRRGVQNLLMVRQQPRGASTVWRQQLPEP
jgi:hypothetical protein